MDYYEEEDSGTGTLAQTMAEYIRAQFTKAFPCGVVEGYPDVYDQDEKRAKIETPFG